MADIVDQPGGVEGRHQNRLAAARGQFGCRARGLTQTFRSDLLHILDENTGQITGLQIIEIVEIPGLA